MRASPFSLASLALIGLAAASCDVGGDGHQDHDQGSDTPTTVISTPATASDLADGQRVRVRFDDSVYPFTATTVEIAGDTTDASGTIEGAVGAVDAKVGTITVMGVKIAVSSDTVFGGIGSLGELSAGQHVQVFVAPGKDGSLFAARIALRPAEVVGVVAGRADAPEGVRIGVMGRTISVTHDTSVIRVGGTCSSGDEDGEN